MRPSESSDETSVLTHVADDAKAARAAKHKPSDEAEDCNRPRQLLLALGQPRVECRRRGDDHPRRANEAVRPTEEQEAEQEGAVREAAGSDSRDRH